MPIDLTAWLPSFYSHLPGSQAIPGRGVYWPSVDSIVTPGTNTCGQDDGHEACLWLQEGLWMRTILKGCDRTGLP